MSVHNADYCHLRLSFSYDSYYTIAVLVCLKQDGIKDVKYMSHLQLALCLLNFAQLPRCPPCSSDAYPKTGKKFNQQLTLNLQIRHFCNRKITVVGFCYKAINLCLTRIL